MKRMFGASLFVLLLATIGVNYALMRAMVRSPNPRRHLAASVLFTLGLQLVTTGRPALTADLGVMMVVTMLAALVVVLLLRAELPAWWRGPGEALLVTAALALLLILPGAGGINYWIDFEHEIVGVFFEVITEISAQLEPISGMSHLFQDVITAAVEE